MTRHNPTLKFFNFTQEAQAEMERIGVHPRGVELMCAKALFRVVKLEGVEAAAAHILKQEMLAADGEAATNRGTIDGSSRSTDVLLMGTDKAFKRLLSKLKGQPFGLPSIGRELSVVLENAGKKNFLLRTSRRELIIGSRPLIMGIVNVTVDSFYPASRTPSEADAVDRALQLVEAGADIIDVGGESTRPGAQPVGEEEERERVTPVIRALASEGHVIISVDTMKASVAEAALQAGAEMVNDVTGLGFDPRMAEAVGGSGAAVVINHIRGTPADMQSRTKYCSVVEEVISELRAKIRKGEDAGIGSESMIIDPGIGFAKKAAHNFEILKRLREFGSLGRPVMVGVSRKSFLGFGRELQPRERFEGSLAASVIAAVNGAHIIRTHDVAAVKKAMRIVEQMR